MNEEHHLEKHKLVYFRTETVWEVTCSCGFRTGKCISEAEADYRLEKRHVSAQAKM